MVRLCLFRLWVQSTLPTMLQWDLDQARGSLPAVLPASAPLTPVLTAERSNCPPFRASYPASGLQGPCLEPVPGAELPGLVTGLWLMEISIMPTQTTIIAPGGILLSVSHVISLSDQAITK